MALGCLAALGVLGAAFLLVVGYAAGGRPHPNPPPEGEGICCWLGDGFRVRLCGVGFG